MLFLAIIKISNSTILNRSCDHKKSPQSSNAELSQSKERLSYNGKFDIMIEIVEIVQSLFEYS